MRKWISAALIAFTLISCEKEHGLDTDHLVYTNYNKQANFKTFETYFISDSILLIGEKKEPEYLKGEKAEAIVGTYIDNMDKKGYVRTDKKEEADLGIQVSYIANTKHFISYTSNPYWWWGYPGYWSPYYWGNWGYWDYSFPVYYNYRVGTVLTEMIDLKAPQGSDKKLPVIWNSYVSGMLTGYEKFDLNLAMRGINQSFIQSEYIQK